MAIITIIEDDKSLAQKVLDHDEITKSDIRSLEMFNELYIEMLLAAGQQVVRQKVAEALTRGGIMEVSP